jgi:Pyruvate/2-oxoacid:ferredoxin oxidoreductase gamma subunit
VNGASFTARTTSFDKGLSALLALAIQNEGFSLVDIWELCTAYYVPNNRFSKSLLESKLDELNFKRGIIQQSSRPEYSRAYRQSVIDEAGKTAMRAHPIEQRYQSELKKRMGIVIAGAAGKKINSAATLFCRGAVVSGLWATQRNDYPVTVKSGHSVAEVILSPKETGYTGISKPDILLLLFKEGVGSVRDQLHRMTEAETVFACTDLLPIETRAKVVSMDFKRLENFGTRKEYWGIIALAKVLHETRIYPLEAFKEAVGARSEFAEENLRAIEEGENFHV